MSVPANPDEIRLFMVVRNESLRLPFTLGYYFSRGVDRIFVVDNNSSDDTASIVLSHKNAHLFHTKDKYRRQGYWIDFLLRRYGVGHWCLVVDADELFVYPFCECIALRQLCCFLDKEHFQTLDCVLLDMYPDAPLDGVVYKRGTDPLLVAHWFDRDSYVSGVGGPLYIDDQEILYDGPERLFGGVRKRIFGSNPCLSKFPLIKFSKSIFLSPGTHYVEGARAAHIRGALLHFKYLNDFSERVREEVARKEHWREATEYKEYLRTLNDFPDINLRSSLSETFVDTNQLVSLGIMKTSDAWDMFCNSLTKSKN
jgi:Glycosyl transferase family 2